MCLRALYELFLGLDFKKMCQTRTLDFQILYQRSSERDIEEYCQELDISTLELLQETYRLDLINLALKEVFF